MTNEERFHRALIHAVTQIEIAERAIDRYGFDSTPTVHEILAALADTLHEELIHARE